MSLDDLALTPRLLVALDFDGTLAPLVDEPLTARMTPAAAEAVAALVASPATTVALVSGRSLVDLRMIAEHGDDSALLLAASHGAEWWTPGGGGAASRNEPDPADAALRDALIDDARTLLAGIDGAWVEPKAFGLGIHSRLVAEGRASEVHERIDALMAQRAPEWRRRSGHSVTEFAFRPEGKDSAIAELRRLTGATGVLFAGDDVTDEDALRSLGAEDVGIRVGPGETAATVRVDGIDDLARLLRALAHRRSSARQ